MYAVHCRAICELFSQPFVTNSTPSPFSGDFFLRISDASLAQSPVARSIPSLFSGNILFRICNASFADSFVSKEEELLGNTAVGEILPYNDYSSIDFLHDLVSS